MTSSFVPDSFALPLRLEHPQFHLRPLCIRDVVKDYDAVMSSVEHLHTQIPPEVFHGVWPDPAMTIEDDLADLGWHQVEFKNRTSFTYTVMKPDESQCLGCVYIFPPRFTDAEAEVFLWVRKSELETELDSILFSAVQNWLKTAWPFASVSYPFRATN